MAQARRIYPSAPIVEAVIDIRVETASANESLKVDGDLVEGLRGSFPVSTSLNQVRLGLRPAEGPILDAPQVVGTKLVSANRDRVVQFQASGFTYSHVPPYTQWETFCDEARQMWAYFIDHQTAQMKVVRLATRYINRLRLPRQVELEHYLTIYPQLPNVIRTVSGVLMQVQIPERSPAEPGQAVVTLASEPMTDRSFQALVLDIDVFTPVRLDPRAQQVWSVLEGLRNTKNMLFEAAITDRLREDLLKEPSP